jgi:hypothetical protein
LIPVYTTTLFAVTPGSHTITFQESDSAGGVNTALVDAIKLTQVTTNHLYCASQWQVIEERQNGTGASNVTYQYAWGAGYVDEQVLRDTYSGGVRAQCQRLGAFHFDCLRHDQTKLGLEKMAILALLTGPITSPRPASPAAISNKSFDYRPARLAGWS